MFADEARGKYGRSKTEDSDRETRINENEDSIIRWQLDGMSEMNDYNFIPNIVCWIGRRHG